MSLLAIHETEYRMGGVHATLLVLDIGARTDLGLYPVKQVVDILRCWQPCWLLHLDTVSPQVFILQQVAAAFSSHCNDECTLHSDCNLLPWRHALQQMQVNVTKHISHGAT